MTVFDLADIDRIMRTDYEGIAAKVNALKNASIAYRRKEGTFQDLYPKKMEGLGLLDPSFGGAERHSPKDDVSWTSNCYYVAPWGDSFEIAMNIADFGLANYLSKCFADELSAAYFPLPDVL